MSAKFSKFGKKAPVQRAEPTRPKFRRIADARYGDEVLGKLINKVMWDGKKSTAEGIVYGALELVETRAAKTKSLIWVFVWGCRRLSLNLHAMLRDWKARIVQNFCLNHHIQSSA